MCVIPNSKKNKNGYVCNAPVSLGDVVLVCEGSGHVVGVVTPLVGGVAQAFRGNQVVELRVQVAVQEVEGKEEDKKRQVEIERRSDSRKCAHG